MARTNSKWQTGVGGTYIQTIAPAGYDILINGTSKYLNFNTTVGSSGYGFRDNAGTMQFKNSGGSWTNFGAGGGGSSVETPVGAVDSSNVSFTVSNEPLWVVGDGITYFEGAGYSYSAGTITMDTKLVSFIRSIY